MRYTMTATKEVDAKAHPVKQVTVFRSGRAEVVRSFTLELEAGDNTIEISHLSNSIVKNSVRVSGVGGAARLADVVCAVATEGSVSPESSDARQALEKKSQHLLAQQNVLVQEMDILRNYAKSLAGDNIPAKEMFKFLEVFREKQLNTLDGILACEEPISEAKDALEKAKTNGIKGRATSTVTLRVYAEQAATITLRLRYVVKNADWEPVYDLYASTQDTKSVKLDYRARVTQSTGEDWTDTELTLSTAAALSKKIHSLPTYKLRNTFTSIFAGSSGNSRQNGGASLFGFPANSQPPQSAFGAPAGSTTGGVLFGGVSAAPAGGLFGSASNTSSFTGGLFGQSNTSAQSPTPSAPFAESTTQPAENASSTTNSVPLSESVAIIRNSTISASYLVQGTIKIPSDGKEHTVSIASLDLEAEVTRVSVPRMRADVYLECKAKNVSEYRLLAGPVSIFLDDGYVSTSAIPDIGTNETIECALGVDPSIRVTYERVPTYSIEPPRAFGSPRRSVTTFTTRTKVHNKHSTPIKRVIIRDALPLGDETNNFKVVLRIPEGLVDASDNEEVNVRESTGGGSSKRKVRWSKKVDGKGGEKEGKYEWIVDLAEGEEAVLLAEWDVKTPINASWEEVAEHD
ncbi:unnamed protein product [Somion occarium]|uniref:Protein F37C4.5 n=1 Tax=Somion occarium TaxID=3059160 RepID=A0ABP1E772_9APHY